MEWVNWSGSQRATPAAVRDGRARAPSSRSAIADGPGPGPRGGRRALVQRRRRSPTGRCSRSTRSHRVLDADARAGLVRVEAGIRLHALSRELHARGLAMPNLGDIDAQSLAGALATGTHGTGARLPNLSGQVECGRAGARRRQRADASTAATSCAPRASSLGALGVDRGGHAALRARVPAAQHRRAGAARATCSTTLQERADAHDHFEFWTFPHSDVALTRTHDRTDDPPRRARPGPRLRRATSCSTTTPSARSTSVARRFPGTIPRLNRFAVRGRLAARARRLVATRSSPRQRLVRFEEMEYALPREHAVEAVRAARAVARAPPGLASRSSCASRAADDALLSPAHGRDSAFVAVHVFQGMRTSRRSARSRRRCRALGGRPHWGKRSFLGAARAGAALPALGRLPGASARELDPDGRFANAWVRHVLG